MNSSNNSVALLVHACDRYEFLYKGFEYFFRRHWDFKIPCNYYFATEVIDTSVKGFQNIKSGKGEWADRLAVLLRHKISEPYVLYFQEDMWLNKDVNTEFFSKLFELTIAKQWKQVKLHSSNTYITEPTNHYVEGFNIARLDNQRSDYLMSHQVTLWEKSFLLAQMHRDEHPWRNERKGTKRLKALNPEIFHIDYFADNGNPAINENVNPVGRSEYQTISVNSILNSNAHPFIDQLKQEPSPEMRVYASELQHHLDNQITHDGKPKPRKEDIFQKLKRRLGLKK